MNEQIMKILPAKKESSYNMPDDWITGYNRALKDCAVAIEKANLVRCPTEKEIQLAVMDTVRSSKDLQFNVRDFEQFKRNTLEIAKSILILLRGEK